MNHSNRTGAGVFWDVLGNLEVAYLFGHTGGAVIPLHVELNRRMSRGERAPRFVLFRQEGGGRACGRGLCQGQWSDRRRLGHLGPGGDQPDYPDRRCL